MSSTIIFSDAASAYVKKIVEQDNGIGLRLSIKKTGCSGYSYLPTVVTEVNPADEVIETAGLTIFIDRKWLDLLQRLQVDYIEEQKGLKQKRLIFTNPKETSRCGCGESFHVE